MVGFDMVKELIDICKDPALVPVRTWQRTSRRTLGLALLRS
jgi:hypothetical protein